MHIFHHWSAWSKPKYGDFRDRRTRRDNLGAEYQDRTCLKCNKYEWRFTNE